MRFYATDCLSFHHSRAAQTRFRIICWAQMEKGNHSRARAPTRFFLPDSPKSDCGLWIIRKTGHSPKIFPCQRQRPGLSWRFHWLALPEDVVWRPERRRENSLALKPRFMAKKIRNGAGYELDGRTSSLKLTVPWWPRATSGTGRGIHRLPESAKRIWSRPPAEPVNGGCGDPNSGSVCRNWLASAS
jgi:hypothetical protein